MARRAVQFPALFACATWMRAFGAAVPSSCKIFGLPAMALCQGSLVLGERVRLQNMRMLYGMGSPFPRNSFFISHGATVEIGDDSYIAMSAIYASKRVVIGKRVLIAAGCRIMDSDGHAVDAVPHPLSGEGDKVSEVRIEDDVWLGCDVMVCKGVTIGKGSVIGAKSVVTHDIPPGVLAAGMPAKVIRSLRLDHKA